MKQFLLSVLILSSFAVFADDPKNDWHNTTLTEATIKKIQEAQYQYKKCVMTEMKAVSQVQQDVRAGTDAIIKKCENVLADMRKVYVDEKVPETIADRHLKQMRIQTTRDVLKQMMFVEAARQAGQTVTQ